MKLNVSAVEIKTAVALEFYSPEAEFLTYTLYTAAVHKNFRYHGVKHRGSDIPKLRVFYCHGLSGERIAYTLYPDSLRYAGNIRPTSVRLIACHLLTILIKNSVSNADTAKRSTLRAKHFSVDSYKPFVLVLCRRDVNPVISEAYLRAFAKPHLSENACSRIPPGVWRMMIHTDSNNVLSVLNKVSDIEHKRRVAVFPLPSQRAVYIHLAVHVNPVKADKSAYALFLLVGKRLSVPACRGFIQVICIINKPIVRNVHRLESKVL